MSSRKYIDNMEAFKSVNQAFFKPQQMVAPEADIILVCHKLHKESRSSTNLEWLWAHQDGNRHKEDLPPAV